MEKRPRGRPKKEFTKQHLPMRIDFHLMKAFREKAKNNKVTLTWLLERAISRELKSALVGGKRN